jgi:flagellar L-ring protein precursor FlgH
MIIMTRIGLLIIILAHTMMLTGCSTFGDLSDPDYEPAVAIMPEQKSLPDGGLFFNSSNQYVFEAIRANHIGDLLTVVLEEGTQASKSASLEADKETNIDFPNPTLFGTSSIASQGNLVLDSNAQANRDTAGEGELTQQNSLSGNITVTVTDKLPNGYLVIKGEKLLTLNEGSEVVRISGLVRPIDISPANTVQSSRIGNAHITYQGNGAVSDSSKASWLYRFFTSVFYPL